MPHLGDISTDYAGKGIQIIALNYGENLSIVQGYQDTYPDILFLLDDGSLYAEYLQNNYIEHLRRQLQIEIKQKAAAKPHSR